ncbi:hypothetical protein [Algivirga pacifica]
MNNQQQPFVTRIEGVYPQDIEGHLFFNTSITSRSEQLYPNTSQLNRERKIVRLDFLPDKVHLTERSIQTACQKLFEKIQAPNHYGRYVFASNLGVRNYLNGTLIPFRYRTGDRMRMLVTAEQGRPFEINPYTLETIDSVGSPSDWYTHVLDQLLLPFCNTCFYPAYADRENAFYFTHVKAETEEQQALEDILFLLDTCTIEGLIESIEEEIQSYAYGYLDYYSITDWYRILSKVLGKVSWKKSWKHLLKGKLKELIKFFLYQGGGAYLYRWNGEGALQKWLLMDEWGKPLQLQRQLYQVIDAEEHLLLIDSSVIPYEKFILNNPFPQSELIDDFLRKLNLQIHTSESVIYAVEKAALINNPHRVEARIMMEPIKGEIQHALLTTENTAKVLHVQHRNYTPYSEWVREYDEEYWENSTTVTKVGSSAINCMDIGKIGKYVFADKYTHLVSESLLAEDWRKEGNAHTWELGYCTYYQEERTTNVKVPYLFWQSYGLEGKQLMKDAYELYKDISYRMAAPDKILQLAEKELPPCILRQNTEEMTFEDSYTFERGDKLLGMQFVPRLHFSELLGVEKELYGYIVCVVKNAQAKEETTLWFFDASFLRKGPFCKLKIENWEMEHITGAVWIKSLSLLKDEG